MKKLFEHLGGNRFRLITENENDDDEYSQELKKFSDEVDKFLSRYKRKPEYFKINKDELEASWYNTETPIRSRIDANGIIKAIDDETGDDYSDKRSAIALLIKGKSHSRLNQLANFLYNYGISDKPIEVDSNPNIKEVVATTTLKALTKGLFAYFINMLSSERDAKNETVKFINSLEPFDHYHYNLAATDIPNPFKIGRDVPNDEDEIQKLAKVMSRKSAKDLGPEL